MNYCEEWNKNKLNYILSSGLEHLTKKICLQIQTLYYLLDEYEKATLLS